MKSIKLTFLVFFISIYSCSNHPDLSGKFYQIVSDKHHKGINVNVEVTGKNTGITLRSNNCCNLIQDWQFELTDNAYIIKSRYNQLVITTKDSLLQLCKFAGSDNQKWKIDKKKDHYYIISAATNKALTTHKNRWGRVSLTLEGNEYSSAQSWDLKKPGGIENADEKFNRLLSVQEMKEDIEYFFTKLYEVHVNPSAFVGKDSLEQRKATLLKNINKPLKLYEFNRMISALNGMFDGHTGIEKMDDEYAAFPRTHYGRLMPFDIKYEPGKIFIQSDEDSLKNLEILSINGISTDSISKELEKRENKENRLARNYFIRRSFHNALFGLFDIESPYIIKVKNSSTNKTYYIDTVGVPGFLLPQEDTYRSHERYNFRIYPKESIAIIEHNTCAIKLNSKEHRELIAFLDSVYNIVRNKKIKNLFIDISRNGGGSSEINRAFANKINHDSAFWIEIFKKKVSLDSKMLITGFSGYNSSEPYSQRLSNYNNYIKGKLSPYQEKIIGLHNGEIYCDTMVNKIGCFKNGFANNAYLIQSYLTYSAGMDLAVLFRYNKIGKIIGSETGGRTETYIEAIPFVLPNSKINFSIADNYIKYGQGDLHKGIEPDVKLDPGFLKSRYNLSDLKELLNEIKDN